MPSNRSTDSTGMRVVNQIPKMNGYDRISEFQDMSNDPANADPYPRLAEWPGPRISGHAGWSQAI
jgi:hypothetical protein